MFKVEQSNYEMIEFDLQTDVYQDYTDPTVHAAAVEAKWEQYQKMIKRWKTDAKFHLRKLHVVFVAVWCCIFCLMIFLSAAFIPDADDIEDVDNDLTLVTDSNTQRDEAKYINVFLIVCKLKHGGPSMVSTTK